MDPEPSGSPDVLTLQADGQSLAVRVDQATRARDEALAAAETERDRVVGAMQQCEHLALEIFAWRKRHAQQTERVAQLTEQTARQTGQLAQQTAQLAKQTTQLAHQAGQLAQQTNQLAHAVATIQNMERSWFWRARRVWVRAWSLVTGTSR